MRTTRVRIHAASGASVVARGAAATPDVTDHHCESASPKVEPRRASPHGLRRMLAYAMVGPKGSTSRRALITAGLVVGAALVAATAAIHLDLWASGYRNIPTIGPLFLLQGIAAVALAVLLVAWRRLGAVVTAAAFMVATIAGLLLSVYVGLFGFMDTLAAPYAGASLVVESAGAVVLGLAGTVLLVDHRRSSSLSVPGAMPSPVRC